MSIFKTYVEQKKLELSTKEIDSVADYFRREFDSMTELVKLYQRKKGQMNGTAYETIAELAFQEGIEKRDGSMLTKSQVCRYLSIVRTERSGKVKAKKKAPSGLVPPVSVAPIVPVVEELKPTPEVIFPENIDPETYPFEIKNESITKQLRDFRGHGVPLVWDSSDQNLLDFYSKLSIDRRIPELNYLDKPFTEDERNMQQCWNKLQLKCSRMEIDMSKFGYKIA